jgi:hypothetical protein
MSHHTRPPQLPPADVDEELEARLRGEMPRKNTRMRMHIDNLHIPDSTKLAMGAVLFLFLAIAAWIINTGESTADKVDQIKDQQAAQSIKQAEQSAEMLSRLSGVELEVQGLKSRTEKLEQEIRK